MSAAFSPDGRLLATGSHDGTAQVWDASTGKRLLTLAGHTEDIRALAFSPNARLLVTGSQDRTAKVWDVLTGDLIRTLEHAELVEAIAFSADGRLLATSPLGATVVIWTRKTTLTMVFKLALRAKSHWRRLNGSELLTDVVGGVPFNDGVRITDEPNQTQEAARTPYTTFDDNSGQCCPQESR